MSTPIYTELCEESRFRNRLQLTASEYRNPSSNFARGWSFAVSLLEDAYMNGDYWGALAVPDLVISHNHDFKHGYAMAMWSVKYTKESQ